MLYQSFLLFPICQSFLLSCSDEFSDGLWLTRRGPVRVLLAKDVLFLRRHGCGFITNLALLQALLAL